MDDHKEEEIQKDSHRWSKMRTIKNKCTQMKISFDR